MEFEDFAEPEIAVTAAVAAAIFSPRARQVMRKGLVYGMAGMLAAGDIVTSFTRSVGQGVQQAGQATQGTEAQANGKENREAGATTASRRKTAPKAETTKVTEERGGEPA